MADPYIYVVIVSALALLAYYFTLLKDIIVTALLVRAPLILMKLLLHRQKHWLWPKVNSMSTRRI